MTGERRRMLHFLGILAFQNLILLWHDCRCDHSRSDGSDVYGEIVTCPAYSGDVRIYISNPRVREDCSASTPCHVASL